MSLADQLITRGWTQETSMDMEGKVCLTGAAACEAVGIYTGAGSTSEGRYDLYIKVLQAAIGEPNIVNYNDTPGRTFDEVLRVAKEADEVIDYLKELNASSQSSEAPMV